MLSIQGSLFHVPKEKKTQAEGARLHLCRPEGDHLSLLNIWEQWAESNFSMQWCRENFIQYRSIKRARDVREQLLRLADRAEVRSCSSNDISAIRKALLSGYFFQTACLQQNGESYRTIKHGQSIYIHPSSVLYKDRPKWLMYHELVLTTKEYMRQASEIKSEWLLDIAPHYFKARDIENLDRGNTAKKVPKTLGRQ